MKSRHVVQGGKKKEIEKEKSPEKTYESNRKEKKYKEKKVFWNGKRARGERKKETKRKKS